MSTIDVPLYSRASDRSIGECSMRWHLERGGHDGVAGASWFDIGTAMHTVYELGIKRQWKTYETYAKHARAEVGRLVEIGQMGALAADVPYLTSKHRPIHEAALDELANHLALTFYSEVIVSPPEWLPPLYGGGWLLEENVRIPHDTVGWEHEAGASTTIDAMHLDDGTFILVDWKTGRSRKSDERQLQFYRYLLELQGYRPAYDVWGAFFHAEFGQWQIVDEYDAQAVERMIASSQAQKKARPEATVSWLCSYCPAQSLCPAWAEDEFDAAVLRARVDEQRKRYNFLLDP